MKTLHPRFILTALVMALALGHEARSADSSPAAGLPSDTPAAFKPRTDAFDFEKREVMIPMRDGVKLKTFILVPKGAKGAPMLLTRTPYNAGERVSRSESPNLASVVPQMDDTAVAAGYIIVFQDVRG
jgi:predicted acyl esterase